MDAIPEQAYLLILFVVIGAIKWVLEKLKGPQEPHDVSETLEDMYEDFREEIRQRQTEVQQPAAAPPPLPRAQQKPPPVHVPATPPASAKLENYKVKQANLSSEEKAALERFQNLGGSKRRRGSTTGSVRDMLSSPDSARKAVILKEILGEPRSMQRI
ncbi:MAG: hypothetical protein AB8F34_15235 [Akkermansiaceae bacterium]